jgi:uncharacterized protein (TIGR02145 family)/prepilin-type N-terminal cleavage/methylation domain-containing protein
MSNTNKKAFTLIELLVVIAIIGILATIAVVALQQVRQSARDSKRIADIKQIQTALEMYYNNNSSYPDNIDSQIADAHNIYMEMVPTAPSPADGDCSSEDNQYVYNPEGAENDSYTISFCLGGQAGDLNNGINCTTPETTVNSGCACAGETSIVYQGYTYDIVVIGGQCWFAENLKYLPEEETFSTIGAGSNSEPRYYVYDYNDGGGIDNLTGDDLVMYNNYGALYNWPAVMQNGGHGGGDGICPEGWHVPTNNEWTELTDYIINISKSTSNIGRRLKSCRQASGTNSPSYCSQCLSDETCPIDDHPRWRYHHTHYGTNDYGFSILPGSYRTGNSGYWVLERFAGFWSSSGGSSSAIVWRTTSQSSAFSSTALSVAEGFSIRCLRTD